MNLIENPLTYNERLLVELVFRGVATTRPEIVEETGLTSATVTRLVTGMLGKGLIREKAERNGAMGQPLRRLSLVPRKAYSIGVNFMRHRFDIALVDLTGEAIGMQQHEIDEITPLSIADLTSRSLDKILRDANVDREDLIGAGFSVPGNFAQDGESLRAHDYFEALDGLSLRPLLEDALNLYCAVETDGACAAVGEYLHGNARNHRNFFFIHIGHGLGGGTVIDGNLYRGPHGNSSKPGALFPYNKPRPSGQDLVETLVSAGAPVSDIADIEAVTEHYAEAVDAWLTRAAEQLADVARIATAFLDPEVIVLGGRLPSTLNSQLVERAQKIQLPGPSRGLPNAKIVASSLGPRTGALGAASIPVFQGLFPGSVSSRGNAYIDGRRRNGKA